MMTLVGSIKAGFSQETELNRKGRGEKKKEFWAEEPICAKVLRQGGAYHVPMGKSPPISGKAQPHK